MTNEQALTTQTAQLTEADQAAQKLRSLTWQLGLSAERDSRTSGDTTLLEQATKCHELAEQLNEELGRLTALLLQAGR